jgi:hypothetical protein
MVEQRRLGVTMIGRESAMLGLSRACRGLLGSAVIQQRVTDGLDAPGLIQAVVPGLSDVGPGAGG